MGKAARIRGRRQESEARAAVQAQADRETLEEAFGERLGDLESALRDGTDLTIRKPGKSISGGHLQRIEVADGPRLKLTIWVDP